MDLLPSFSCFIDKPNVSKCYLLWVCLKITTVSAWWLCRICLKGFSFDLNTSTEIKKPAWQPGSCNILWIFMAQILGNHHLSRAKPWLVSHGTTIFDAATPSLKLRSKQPRHTCFRRYRLAQQGAAAKATKTLDRVLAAQDFEKYFFDRMIFAYCCQFQLLQSSGQQPKKTWAGSAPPTFPTPTVLLARWAVRLGQGEKDITTCSHRFPLDFSGQKVVTKHGLHGNPPFWWRKMTRIAASPFQRPMAQNGQNTTAAKWQRIVLWSSTAGVGNWCFRLDISIDFAVVSRIFI